MTVTLYEDLHSCLGPCIAGWVIHSQPLNHVGNPWGILRCDVIGKRDRRHKTRLRRGHSPQATLTSLILLLLAHFAYCVSNMGLSGQRSNNLEILIKFCMKVMPLGQHVTAE
jgi:hypothetical protein